MNQRALFWVSVVVAIGVLFFVGFSNFLLEKSKTGEEIPAATDDEAMAVDAIWTDMIGSWESLDDSKYVMVLKEDNTYEELYDSELKSAGTWLLFADPAEQGLDIETNFENSVFMEKKDGATGGLFYYNVAVANGEELTITYLQGGVLRFKRVN